MHLPSFASCATLAVGLLSVFSAVGLTNAADKKIRELKALSLEPPYVDEGFRPLHWDYGGDVVIDTYSHVRLASDASSRQGHIWSNSMLPTDTWKVEFEFKIHGKGSYLYGDGLAFWAAKERSTGGPVFGNRDYFTGLGIFFDTYANSKHTYSFPIITAMVGDGRTPYDAAGDGEKNSKGRCHAMIRNTRKESARAMVTYLKGKFLEVRVMTEKDKWVDCFTVNDITLPSGLYLGFSAHTGEISDNHDLLWVKSETMDSKSAESMRHGSGAAQPTFAGQATGSVLGFWFKLMVVGAICGMVFMGYRAYAAKQNEKF
ncbi:hypothetical protein H4R34_005483 [Dimargaris verticillata]|uniref:L-type lectin-like domain-containing protein n=1 Tax=Dimargaris verticillata TaxID=2761393 RepID=A0A9W8AY41_9FUNG|nr:hypothetical protein H4R34_005483 [Dimargaris verticillata]